MTRFWRRIGPGLFTVLPRPSTMRPRPLRPKVRGTIVSHETEGTSRRAEGPRSIGCLAGTWDWMEYLPWWVSQMQWSTTKPWQWVYPFELSAWRTPDNCLYYLQNKFTLPGVQASGNNPVEENNVCCRTAFNMCGSAKSRYLISSIYKFS